MTVYGVAYAESSEPWGYAVVANKLYATKEAATEAFHEYCKENDCEQPQEVHGLMQSWNPYVYVCVKEYTLQT